jgi:hypothetical protein
MPSPELDPPEVWADVGALRTWALGAVAADEIKILVHNVTFFLEGVKVGGVMMMRRRRRRGREMIMILRRRRRRRRMRMRMRMRMMMMMMMMRMMMMMTMALMPLPPPPNPVQAAVHAGNKEFAHQMWQKARVSGQALQKVLPEDSLLTRSQYMAQVCPTRASR